jgi:hypothetical protein
MNGVKGPGAKVNLFRSQGMLSQKLDAMLKELKLMEINVKGNSIKILNQLQKYCPTAESMVSKKYSEELTMAAAQMES